MKDAAPSHREAAVRARYSLAVVDGEDVGGFTLPLRAGPYRGQGDTDLACGRCGGLLVIGLPRDVFRSFVLPCPCGALNRA